MRLQIIERQRSTLRNEIAKLIGRDQPYALVDFPNYPNPGDSAIWLGARKLLREVTGREPDYTCSDGSYDPAKVGNGAIFITGGGNFGDLYRFHQAFRFRLMADFPDRAIVQLPQSIHFNDAANIAPTAEAIARHGKFTMMVRDAPSAAFAVEHFACPVILAPDCAFGLGPLERGEAADEYVAVLRSDGEATGIDYAPLVDLVEAIVCDWRTEPPLPNLRRRASVKALASGTWSRAAVGTAWRDLMAEHRLHRALGMISLGKVCVTDRLHGHILSVLADIPGVAFDNSTGKVSGYHGQWMPDLETRKVVRSAEEALKAIPQLTP